MVAYGKKNFASAGEEELLCPSIVYGNIVEVLPDQLYWAMTTTSDGIEAKSNLAIYVSFADKYHYEPFYQDFGPWNLSVLYRLCKLIDSVVTRERRHKRKIVMYCSSDDDDEVEKLRANCAYVMAGYLMIFHGLSADAAYLRIEPAQPPPFVGFRDAAMGEPTYLLHLHDVLRGIEQAQRHKWLDFSTFDADEYEYYEKVENGDFNWIIPGKVLSFCGPHNESKVEDGYPYHSPETYFDYFRDNNLTTIIRLNTKIYDARKFTNAGFDHVDLFFIDGSVPSDDIVERFIDVVDTSKGAVAVHCKAGLGRTGTLIACWMMKKYGLSAAECIAWLRICRPGSVIGPQQGFLVDKQKFCWSMSERNVVHHPNNKRRGSSKEKKSSLKKLMNKVDEMKVSWKSANNNDKSEKEKSSSKHEENEVLNNGNSNVNNANPEVISDETYVDSEGRSQGDRLLALKAKSQHQNMNQNQNQDQNHSDLSPRSSNSAGTNGINGDRNTRSSRMSPNYSPPANYQHQSLRSSQKPNHQNNAHRPRRHIHLSPLRHENHDANRTQGTDILRFNNAMILEPSSTVYPMVSRYGSREPTRYSSPTTPIKQPLPTGYLSRVDKYRMQLQLPPIEASPPIARVTVRSESQTRKSSNFPQSKSTSAIRKMNPSGSKVSSSRSRPYPPPTSGIRMEMAATNYDLRSKSGIGKSSPGREAASQLSPDTRALIGQRRSKRLSS